MCIPTIIQNNKSLIDCGVANHDQKEQNKICVLIGVIEWRSALKKFFIRNDTRDNCIQQSLANDGKSSKIVTAKYVY